MSTKKPKIKSKKKLTGSQGIKIGYSERSKNINTLRKMEKATQEEKENL